MLALAPVALRRGYTLLPTSRICSNGSRGQPHCFFQPLRHQCAVVQPRLVTDRSTQSGPDIALWPTATQQDVTEACQLLAAEDAQVQCAVPLFAWRRVAQVVLRVQPDIAGEVERRFLRLFPLNRTRPFGAVHIRRTDKVTGPNPEAQAVPICRYADSLSRLSNARGGAWPLSVFVATDAPAVLEEFKACPAAQGWQLFWFGASLCRGKKDDCMLRLWADITMLVQSTWAVVTFTSNIGRLVQVLRTQPPETLFSIDSSQHFLTPYSTPPHSEEEWLELGGTDDD
jgi:hypothetical protein